ncbi:hypothetical protein LWC05_10045 [Acetobacter sicerae]|uniref:Protoheme IX farnesyltransferase n=1 Tax=Acetobacter sicerae TaxID=85325 RepID=A0ABS8VZZ3_9PROT|nr:hypothetical protein [Acetobacter sicerae]MCE0744222.1 hypothetical protein [Acetobacter sicerae]
MMTVPTDLTEVEQTELLRRQRGRVISLVGFTLAMVLVVYVVALIRL